MTHAVTLRGYFTDYESQLIRSDNSALIKLIGIAGDAQAGRSPPLPSLYFSFPSSFHSSSPSLLFLPQFT